MSCMHNIHRKHRGCEGDTDCPWVTTTINSFLVISEQGKKNKKNNWYTNSVSGVQVLHVSFTTHNLYFNFYTLIVCRCLDFVIIVGQDISSLDGNDSLQYKVL